MLGKRPCPEAFPALGLNPNTTNNSLFYTPGTQPLQTWPSFLVIHSLDDKRCLNKINPFTIQKTVDFNAGGTVTDVSTTRAGDLIVQTKNKAQTEQLLKCVLFIDIPVSVTPHNTRNSSRGVIKSRSVQWCDDDELLQGLAPQGVTSLRRITITKEGINQPTNTIILTFQSPQPPSHIKLGYERIKVDIFIPNPLRCNKCQKFGHHHSQCRAKEPVCAICGENHVSNHTSPCSNTPKCANCHGAHPTFSKNCPTWMNEKKVVAIKHNQNISFPEARKKVESMNSIAPPAFIKAWQQKPAVVNTETQCQLIVPNQATQLSQPRNDLTLESTDKIVYARMKHQPPKSTIPTVNQSKSTNTQNTPIQDNADPKMTSQRTIPQRQHTSTPTDEETTLAVQSILPRSSYQTVPPSFTTSNPFSALDSMDCSGSSESTNPQATGLSPSVSWSDRQPRLN